MFQDAPKPISADDAHTVLAGLEALDPSISHVMDKLISDNAAFKFKDRPILSLFPGIPVFVKQDLNTVQGSASKFLAAIVEFVPVRVSLLDITSIFAHKFLSGGYGSSSQVYSRIHHWCDCQSYHCLLLIKSRWFMGVVRYIEFQTTCSTSSLAPWSNVLVEYFKFLCFLRNFNLIEFIIGPCDHNVRSINGFFSRPLSHPDTSPK